MNSHPILNVEGVNLSLQGPNGKVDILKNIHLQIGRHEKISIMGPSGSGKTSLLLLLAGLERASSGSITVAGQDISHFSEDALAVFRRRTVGIVFQNFHLIPAMSALENVAVPLEFAGEDKPFEQAKAALASVGLGHRIHHFPSQLSGGEQQRVALARAFVMRPGILLADEPTGNLDQETGKQIVELMLQLHAVNGTTLLLVTHDKTLAERCDRMIKLRDGSIV